MKLFQIMFLDLLLQHFGNFPSLNLNVILFPKVWYESSILSVYRVTCSSITFSPSFMQSIITLKILIKDSPSYHILTFLNERTWFNFDFLFPPPMDNGLNV